MNTVIIYGLYDPRKKDLIRYVGKTTMSLKKRLQGHIDESRNIKSPTYKKYWIQSLLKENIRPEIKIIEECSEEIWQEREIYWISQFTKLTNTTIGGEDTGIMNVAVIRYTINGIFDKIYESIESACSDNNLERGVINSALQRNPEGGYGGGFLWRYAMYQHKNFIEPYINPKNKIHRIIDLQTNESKLFENLKEGLEYFNIKRVGNINRCIINKVPVKKRYFIMQIN